MATRAMPSSMPTDLPGDILLMNITAALLAGIGALALLATGVLWVAHQQVFAVRGIRIDGDLSHNSVLTIRANAAPKLAGNFFTLDLGRRAPRLRSGAVGAPGDRAPRLAEPARGAAAGAPRRGFLDRAAASDGDDEPDKLVNSFGEVFEANLGDVEEDALPSAARAGGQLGARLLGLNRPGCSRCSRRSVPVSTRSSMSGRGSMHVDARHRRRDRARPRHRRRRSTARTREFAAHAAAGHAALSTPAAATPTCVTATATRCASKGIATATPDARQDQEENQRHWRQESTDGQGNQGSGGRPGHRHRQDHGGGGRGDAGRRAAHRRPRQRAHARAEARRGRQHRRDGAVDPAGAERGRDDGRLQDHARLHRHHRQPHPGPEQRRAW